MDTEIGSSALRPNPALASLAGIIGTWVTTGTHPYFKGVALHGRASFEWIEGGAFLRMRQEVNHPQFPDGTAIFGSDDSAGTIFMLYFDERGVSRKYEVTMSEDGPGWWRDDPGFSQRFDVQIDKDGLRMTGRGRMSRGGQPWEDDLSLDYARTDQVAPGAAAHRTPHPASAPVAVSAEDAR